MTRQITVTSCAECPYLKHDDLDWDYKEMPICRKTNQKLSIVRIDTRFNKTLSHIPKTCTLDKVPNSVSTEEPTNIKASTRIRPVPMRVCDNKYTPLIGKRVICAQEEAGLGYYGTLEGVRNDKFLVKLLHQHECSAPVEYTWIVEDEHT